MPPIRPSVQVFQSTSEAERQRVFGLLRNQQRAASPIVKELRDQGIIGEGVRAGEIHIKFEEEGAVRIQVLITTMDEHLLAKFSRKG